EHYTFNVVVLGSNPSGITRFKNLFRDEIGFFLPFSFYLVSLFLYIPDLLNLYFRLHEQKNLKHQILRNFSAKLKHFQE
ncbi:hypothetical protein, partial [Pedobacter panaciterrae]|uniref:hypothetical protein n=1 Tax=Pedobacter panaciterrae TaxID=363849 RepID=UPI003F690140